MSRKKIRQKTYMVPIISRLRFTLAFGKAMRKNMMMGVATQARRNLKIKDSIIVVFLY